MNAALIIGSYGVVALASVYLLVKTRLQYLIYSVVLVLTLGSVLGSLFSILHMPGADQLLLVGFAGTVLGAVLLVWKSFRNAQRQILFYKLMAGLILLLQIIAYFFWPEQSTKAALINYPLTAFLATVLINEQYEHSGERNMLILFTLQGFLYILIEVIRLI